ncbi:DUF349 domain-containing protein [Flavobacterium sp. HJ-32-4]|nr:DUF349 domain-containing protein [Flavobacterium sp. HJ-32-4]UMY64477.1 DUF349 domain-containing protein [Flavobacterium sp. HJ-32-4]
MTEEKPDNLQEADGNTENQPQTTSENVAPQPENITPDETVVPDEVAPEAPVAEAETAEAEPTVGDVTEEAEAVSEDVTSDEIEPVTETLEGSATAEVETEVTDAPVSDTEDEMVAAPSEEGIAEAIAASVQEADIAEPVAETETVSSDAEEVPAPADATPSEDAPEVTENDAVAAINESNAEEGEHETTTIPEKDYEALDLEELVAEFEKLAAVDNVMSVRHHVEKLRNAFQSKYLHFIDEKRKEFYQQEPESTEEFQYHLPLKQKFDKLYSIYRDSKNRHLKDVQRNLETNLAERLAIVEELKELINPNENIKDTLRHFNELRERWKNAGPIPKDKYNHVWNNYHFHVENFYDYLHLDRDARDADFRHNLEKKERIITRAQELLNETDILKAFRELQDLHRIWKEEIGPVSREHREDVWNRFSAITKQMHDKRESMSEEIRARENANLEKKKEIIAQIAALSEEKQAGHSGWQKQVEKVEALRNAFFAVGKVPSEVNEQTWAEFKTAVRTFNSVKNNFYKDIKREQTDNLNRKLALVAKANELKDTEDFAAATPAMKQIQEEWKTIGHVPRKYSDKIWKDFREACNLYFERLKANRNEANSEELEAFEKKKAYLETLKDFEFTGDHRTDLANIKTHIEHWKTLGKVPMSRRHVDGKFNKVLDVLFEKLSLSKKDSEMARFSSRIDQFAGGNDTRRLDNEKIFLMRKIDETNSEILQLENNIQFFSSKDPKKENPMVAEVRKNIQRHKDELEVLKEKLRQLRNIGKASEAKPAQAEASETETPTEE